VTWVDVPVYDPGRRRSWLRHSGALAGLLFGVVAVVIALLAR
jgi:hypothetical protein